MKKIVIEIIGRDAEKIDAESVGEYVFDKLDEDGYFITVIVDEVEA